jgi:hydroxylamine reductase (hybrid-cluster protein)
MLPRFLKDDLPLSPVLSWYERKAVAILPGRA